MKNLIFIILLFTSNTLFSQSKKEIKLDLKKSEAYELNQKVEQYIVQTVMGAEQEIKSNMESLVSYYVKDIVKDQYQVDIEYKKLKLNLQTIYFTIDYDSEKPASEEDAMAKVFNKMIGKKSHAVIDQYGKVVEFKGIEDMYNDILNELNVPEDKKMQLKAQLEQSFGDDAQKGSIEALTAVYPKEAVALNSTWTNTVNLKTTIPITMTNTWKYDQKNGSGNVITGEGEIKSSAEEIMLNGMQAKVDINGKQDSQLTLDSKTGWIQSGEIASEIEGSVTINNQNIPGGSMEIPMHITTKTVYSSK